MAQAMASSINLATTVARSPTASRQPARAAAPAVHVARSACFRSAGLRTRAPRAQRNASRLACRAQASVRRHAT